MKLPKQKKDCLKASQFLQMQTSMTKGGGDLNCIHLQFNIELQQKWLTQKLLMN